MANENSTGRSPVVAGQNAGVLAISDPVIPGAVNQIQGDGISGSLAIAPGSFEVGGHPDDVHGFLPGIDFTLTDGADIGIDKTGDHPGIPIHFIIPAKIRTNPQHIRPIGIGTEWKAINPVVSA